MSELKRDTSRKVALLKNNNEDFEFYPTTEEIAQCVRKDIIKESKKTSSAYFERKGTKGYSYLSSYNTIHYNDRNTSRNKKAMLHLSSFLDIGAGDGRMAEWLFAETKGIFCSVDEKLAIEKAKLQANDLIRRGFGLIGRDFYDISLMESKFGVVYSNPPYSEYKQWVGKILEEVNSKLIYLLLPQRWRTDDMLVFAMEDKGEVSSLGFFDFEEADRVARAKVELIKINTMSLPSASLSDTFDAWIKNTFGAFESIDDAEVVEEPSKEEDSKNNVEQREGDMVGVLVENYQKELADTKRNYKQLGSIDFSIIEQLGVSKSHVMKKIRSDIKNLRVKYWRESFNLLTPITTRLTTKMRDDLMQKVTWFDSLTFNAGNVYSVVVWVIENGNQFVLDQAIAVYDSMMSFDNVTAYKSNTKWTDGGWRYNNEKIPEKYQLDYRVVVEGGIRRSGYAATGPVSYCIASDLAIVADTLGFPNHGVSIETMRKKHYCMGIDGEVVFEYKFFQNNNVHIKMNQAFLMKLNVEIGKLKGWIMQPHDVESEFEVSAEEAESLFGGAIEQLTSENAVKLLACA